MISRPLSSTLYALLDGLTIYFLNSGSSLPLPFPEIGVGAAPLHDASREVKMWWVRAGRHRGGGAHGEEGREPRYSEDMAPGATWGLTGGVIGAEWAKWVGSSGEEGTKPRQGAPLAQPLVKASLIAGYQKYQHIKGNMRGCFEVDDSFYSFYY